LAITNPLVLYQSLVATKRILPDPAQYRLAIHLQKLYDRLINYEPTASYSARLSQLSRVIENENGNGTPRRARSVGAQGVWQSLIAQKEQRDTMALTRVLTDHESAMHIDSPKGLLLHGEVGTGKSMLIDLFADCLPSNKKRRWHFSTFMLETVSKLERIRHERVGTSMVAGRSLLQDEHSLLRVAKDLISTSPILFLDEFQLPDRASSKIMANLMTSFFQLGGVLIATSNRMPEELAKAAGIQFGLPPSRLDSIKWRFGLRARPRHTAVRDGGRGEFANFLELLNARCDDWQVDSKKDYRRRDSVQLASTAVADSDSGLKKPHEPMGGSGNANVQLPEFYLIGVGSYDDVMVRSKLQKWIGKSISDDSNLKPKSLSVFGRTLMFPKTHEPSSTLFATFEELCEASLGPADYISIASAFKTVVLMDAPVLTNRRRNEARRFITLIDAMYECRCRLMMTAEAAVDDLFFPTERASQDAGDSMDEPEADAIHAESFSDAYQDATAPFRPNVASYDSSSLPADALEDDPPNRLLRQALGRKFKEGDLESSTQRPAPDFARIGQFTGEDEKFAFRRAESRLWEMCGARWWAQAEQVGRWKPIAADVRTWELKRDELHNKELYQHTSIRPGEGDDAVFRNGGNSFRTMVEPPPKIGVEHAWGVVRWGKKAGAWGKGVEGLNER
ncbi:hypothetical protein P152DRAFT_379640, partial [Eremomyces bilateralis CBS 781.70]